MIDCLETFPLLAVYLLSKWTFQNGKNIIACNPNHPAKCKERTPVGMCTDLKFMVSVKCTKVRKHNVSLFF